MNKTPSMNETIAIVGAGLIGRDWAIVFARAGCQVRILRPGPQDLRALAREVSSLGSQSRA